MLGVYFLSGLSRMKEIIAFNSRIEKEIQHELTGREAFRGVQPGAGL
jgi:hypothetical protein